MASANPPAEQNTINLKLAELVKNLPTDQQLILIGQLLKGNFTPILYRLIGKLTDKQQVALLEQLQAHAFKTVNLEETEIALRGHNRKSCMLSTDYKIEGRNFEGFMLDISPAGTFIETSEPFNAGLQISLSFTLPISPKQLNINGKILWKGMLGIGVEFLDLTPDQLELINAFMEVEDI